MHLSAKNLKFNNFFLKNLLIAFIYFQKNEIFNLSKFIIHNSDLLDEILLIW